MIVWDIEKPESCLVCPLTVLIDNGRAYKLCRPAAQSKVYFEDMEDKSECPLRDADEWLRAQPISKVDVLAWIESKCCGQCDEWGESGCPEVTRQEAPKPPKKPRIDVFREPSLGHGVTDDGERYILIEGLLAGIDSLHEVMIDYRLPMGAQLHRFNNGAGVPYSAIYQGGHEMMSAPRENENALLSEWIRCSRLYEED